MFNTLCDIRKLVTTFMIGLLICGAVVALSSAFYATDPKVLTAVESALNHRELWRYILGGLLSLALVTSSIAIARGQDRYSVGAGLIVVLCFLALGHASFSRISERKMATSRTTDQKIENRARRIATSLGNFSTSQGPTDSNVK